MLWVIQTRFDVTRFDPPPQPDHFASFSSYIYLNALFSGLPGAQSENDAIDDDDGHGAAILSLKSHVKLNPLELSYPTSAGKLLSRHPACISDHELLFPFINL